MELSYISGNGNPKNIQKNPLWKKFLYFWELSSPMKLNKTPLEETECLSNHWTLLAAQLSSVLIYPPSPNTVSGSPRGYLSLTVQRLCDLRNAMSRHWSSSASHQALI